MTAAPWGVCVNARGEWAPADDLNNIGAKVVRTIVYDQDEFDDVISTEPPGTQIIAVMNTETNGVGAGYPGWGDAIAVFAKRFAGRVQAIECANEWDLNGVEPSLAASLARQALAPCTKAGIQVLLGSVAGPDWGNALKRAMAALTATDQKRLAGVCFHPYGQRASGWPDGFGFGEMDAALATVYSIARRPVWVTEYGIDLRDCGSPESQAIYFTRARAMFAHPPVPVGAACYFAWSDAVGGPDESFGLRDREGNPRATYGAAVACGALL